MATPTVLATSGSLSGIKRIIGEYYYSPNIRTEQLDTRTYAVYNAKGRVWDVIVIKKGKRWYFQTTHGRRNPTKRYLLEPKYFNATVWSYDVWGNARDGWEVNNRFKFGTWKVMEGVLDTNKGVLQFLKQINFLKKGTQLRSLSFDGDDRLIIVDAAKDGYPLCSIELD